MIRKFFISAIYYRRKSSEFFTLYVVKIYTQTDVQVE
jgi:hypothetical protein